VRRLLAAVIVIAPLSAALALGCGDDSGRSTACSTGPARTSDPPFSDREGFDGNEPICQPRCGQNRLLDDAGRSTNLPALPSGSCEFEDEKCQARLDSVCAVHGIGCACRSGQWECFIVSMGGGVCAAPVVDAAAD
jgi:hypothetical protein